MNTYYNIQDYQNLFQFGINKKEDTQIYNMHENENNLFRIQFKQLIAFFNFRRKFKEALNTGTFIVKDPYDISGKERNNEGYIQNLFYLIDKKWLEQWRKHVGYEEISKYCHQNNINRDLNEDDYKWIKPYIDKNTRENKLCLLNNQIIYNSDKIDRLSDFAIIDKESYKSFTFEFNKNLFNYETIKCRAYPVKILKEKLLLVFDLLNYQIIFKDNGSKLYFEILIEFEENNRGRKETLDKIEKIDINEWIKKSGINILSDSSKDFNFFNCKFKLINKTLLLYKKNQVKNCVIPNLNNEEKTILLDDKAKISNSLKFEMTRHIIDIQNKNKGFGNLHNNQIINTSDNQKMILNNNQKVGNLDNNKNITTYGNQNMIFNNFQNIGNLNNNQNMNNFVSQQMMLNWNCMNNFGFQQKMPNYNQNGKRNNNNQNMNNYEQNKTQNSKWNNNQNMNNFGNQQMIQDGEKNKSQNLIQNQFKKNQKNELEPNKTPQEIQVQHKIGLINIGQTCYMNASIQALSNITELSRYLLIKFSELSINIDNQPLTAAYSSLLYELFFPKDNEKYISPNIFKEIIGELNPLFKGMHAADAKDLIFFIIEKLHKELNPFNLDQKKISQIDFEQQEKNSINEKLMLQLFFKDFQTKNKTKISDLFYGITRSTMKCEECKITKYAFQTFNLLIFQLKKVKEGKKKELGEYYGNYNETLNLYDAFNIEQREEILEGENMIYCNKCNCLRKGKHQQKIFTLPKVIIIVLNRGKNNEDFNEEFDFPLYLDLNNRGIIINPISCHKYYLCGVITHLGESSSSGHFIAYCRDGPDSQFFCYNDASINPVKNEDAIKTIISHNDYEKKTPYVLFYHHL